MIVHLKEFFLDRTGRSIGIIFGMNGLVFGSWAAFIPYIKEKFSLDEAQLGLLLLSMPAGVLIVNPISVYLIRHWGAVKTALIFAVLTGFGFLLPIIIGSITWLPVALVLSGGFFGITNISMNTCGSVYEELSGKRLISSCHGMWSVGAMSGALLSGLSLRPLQQCCGAWLEPQMLYVLIQGVIVLFVIVLIRRDLEIVKTAHIPPKEGSGFQFKLVKLGKDLWAIIIICLCTYLTEGTISDWSSVYLREVTNASAAIAGHGFAVYAFFMAAGRFLGDDLIARYGNMRVLRAGGFLVLAGLMLIIFSTSYLFAMPGFMLTGSGISLASPILYQASAKLKGLAPGVGLATMNTFAMAAFLGGPVLIGFVAQISSLRISFILVAIAAIIWILQSHKIIYKNTRQDATW